MVRKQCGGRSSAAWLLGSSVAFAVLGIGLIFLRDNATAHSKFYTGTPQFKVWATLVIGMIASLPVVWRVGIDLLGLLDLDLRRVLLRSRLGPALASMLLVVTAAVVSAGTIPHGADSAFYGELVRLGAVYVLATAATAPAFLTMWECYRQAADGGGAGGQPADAGVTHLLLLRQCLLSALTTVGLLVSAGVLATGADRQAVLADPRFVAPYPSAYVLIWGFSFSALLVVNFLPAFRRLTRLASATIDAVLPLFPPGSDQWQERLQERKDLADLLKLTSGSKDVITSGILVAGPLISSAFSLFLASGSG
jgi:hypothetical protein